MFHLPGLVYVVTTVVLVLGAINGQNNLLFIIFGLAVGGLIVSGLVSGANLMGIRVDRLESEPCAAGEIATVRYRVSNRNWMAPAFGLQIEELPDPQMTDGIVQPMRGFVAHVPAKGLWGKPDTHHWHVEAQGSGLARRRGVAKLSRFRVVSSFPFGLTKKSVTFDCPMELLVLPAPLNVIKSPLAGARGRQGNWGDRKPQRVGEEFFSLREYSSGDSPRSIAWKASARSGHLLVREMINPVAPRVVIEIDVLGRQDHATEQCISAAAGLCLDALERGFDVSIKEHGGRVLMGYRRVGRRDGMQMMHESGVGSEQGLDSALSPAWSPQSGPLEVTRSGQQGASTRGLGQRAFLAMELLARWEKPVEHKTPPGSGREEEPTETMADSAGSDESQLRVIVSSGAQAAAGSATGGSERGNVIWVHPQDEEIFDQAHGQVPAAEQGGHG